MLRVRDDDADAFGELMSLYWPRIFGHFYRSLRDRQEAEDLTQDVFLRLYRSRKRYQPRARFTTWLYHISQNVARNAFRSRKKPRPMPLDGKLEWDDSADSRGLLADYREAPGRPIERTEVALLVRAAVANLGDRQRTAMEMHQFEDHTYAEVAQRLDMSPDAAKSLLYRARNQLRDVLAGYMDHTD